MTHRQEQVEEIRLNYRQRFARWRHELQERIEDAEKERDRKIAAVRAAALLEHRHDANNIDERGIQFIAYREGFSPVPYKVPGAGELYFTWGYGHYGPDVPATGTISRRAALRLLTQDVAIAVQAVRKIQVDLDQGQFNALVSLAFNIGPNAFLGSTLFRVLNAGKYERVPFEFRKWVYAGGNRMEGLERRREAEIRMWKGLIT